MFSSRTPADLSRNRLARALDSVRSEGVSYLDLTQTNPTTAGLDYPPELLTALSKPAAAVYDPHPFGLPAAREAVARELARHGADIDPSRVVLTSSTSEAYSLLIRLLCDPGDEVLVPQPSYPLFDHLVRLDGCVTAPYRLEYRGKWLTTSTLPAEAGSHEKRLTSWLPPSGGRWSLSEPSLDEAISSRSRAIVAVSPNNPTGSYVSANELAVLMDRCSRHELALIVDEVFADYVLETGEAPSSAAAGEEHAQGQPALDLPPKGGSHEEAPALRFSLGGLSKAVGLPQLKLAWMVVAGPAPLVDAALLRLEVICDTYLSVSTPVQHAAADLLAAGRLVRQQIQTRIRRNLATLKAAAGGGCEVLRAEGGWSAVLRVPASRSEEDLVVTLLAEDRVLVHPGYFFDFPHEAFLVVSLLPQEGRFQEAIARVLRRATE